MKKGKKRDLSDEEEESDTPPAKPIPTRGAAPSKAKAAPKPSVPRKNGKENMEGEEKKERKQVRKVRRGVKTVTSTNKRGYEGNQKRFLFTLERSSVDWIFCGRLVTEDVSTDESYCMFSILFLS